MNIIENHMVAFKWISLCLCNVDEITSLKEGRVLVSMLLFSYLMDLRPPHYLLFKSLYLFPNIGTGKWNATEAAHTLACGNTDSEGPINKIRSWTHEFLENRRVLGAHFPFVLLLAGRSRCVTNTLQSRMKSDRKILEKNLIEVMRDTRRKDFFTLPHPHEECISSLIKSFSHDRHFKFLFTRKPL